MLFWCNSVVAQIDCSFINFSVNSTATCCSEIKIDNRTECFPEFRLLLDKGNFISFKVNSSLGFSGVQLSPTEFLITHAGGFIPVGVSIPCSFCVSPGTSPNLSVLWDNKCLLEACFADLLLNECPILADACIEGVKYRECRGADYTNQTKIPKYAIDLFDANGKLLQSTETDLNGEYYFCDLPPGSYIVKEANHPGWSASVPASGQYNVTLKESEIAFRNFGNCPTTCHCDSIYVNIIQEVIPHLDTGFYYLNVSNSEAFCFNFIDVELDSGQLVGWELLLPDWKVSLQGPNFVKLSPPNILIPEGSSIPLRLIVQGGYNHKLTIKTEWNDGLNKTVCKSSQIFPFPIKPSLCICPGDIITTNNLIPNGDFILGYNGFYTGLNSGIPSNNCGQNRFNVLPNLQAFCPGWPPTPPPLTPRMLCIDGRDFAPSATVLWGSFVFLQSSTNYCFSFRWISALDNQIIPIDIRIIKTSFPFTSYPILLAGNLTGPRGVWIQNSYSFNSPILPGSYRIEIRQTSSAARRDFGIDDICLTKKPPPCNASFTFEHDSCGLYTFNSIVIGTAPYTYSWNFGDPSSLGNNISSLPVPTHQYNGPGPYSVVLTITDATGCISTSSNIINLVTYLKNCCDTCVDNLVMNPGFVGSISGNTLPNPWVNGSGTPDKGIQQGACDQGYVQLWGTTNHGESIKQNFNFQPGHTYSIKLKVRNIINPILTNYVIVGFTVNNLAINGPINPFNLPTGDPRHIGNTVSIPYLTPWTTYTLPNFNCPSGTGYDEFYIRAYNNAPISPIHPDRTLSWAHIDNICIEDITDSCECGKYDFLYAIGRGPLQLKNCGDTLIVPASKSLLPIQFYPSFSCIGDSCSATIDWKLTGPIGSGFIPLFINQVNTNPGYSIPITNASFPYPGLYTLTVTGYCDGKPCPPCTLYFYAEGHDCCKYREDFCMTIMNAVSLNVNNANCKVTLNIGNLPKCDSIGPIDWGDGTQLSGPFGAGSMPMHIYPSSGAYVISYLAFEKDPITGYFCFEKFFRIPINIKCDSCDCNQLHQDVIQGFSVSGNKLSCKRTFKPLALCPNDMVSWTVTGPGNPLNTFGSTTGNNPVNITFTSPGGVYTVCMIVTRFDPSTMRPCKDTLCRRVIVKCKLNPIDPDPKVTFCPSNSIKNGDFTEGVVSGQLDSGGVISDWNLISNAGGGFVFIDGSSGASDDGHVILVGGKENFAGIWQKLDLPTMSMDSFVILEYFITNYSGKDIPPGSEIEFRLQGDTMVGSPFQIIHTQSIDSTLSGWVGISNSIKLNPDPEKMYLVICLQSQDMSKRSFVGIDNIEICTSPTVGIVKIEDRKNVLIFPNPTAGELTLKFNNINLKSGTIQIYDIYGKLAYSEKLLHGAESHTLSINELPTSVYFIKVFDNGVPVWTEKIIKQ